MNVLAILKDFTLRCKSVFENTTTKMGKRFLNWLILDPILTIRTVALIPGKVNSTRLSRYGGRTAKTFAVSRLNNYFDLRKISASQNNSENKSSVGSVSGLAKAEQPQILPNHCIR